MLPSLLPVPLLAVPADASPADTSAADDSAIGFAPHCAGCLTLMVETGDARFPSWRCAQCGRLRVS
ncbi:MAG: hypothetical protein K0S37_2789 [Microbacterium sp.]|jgi:hypothetical protein|nr:hypothetical protein [Microbacterium sp.]